MRLFLLVTLFILTMTVLGTIILSVEAIMESPLQGIELLWLPVIGVGYWGVRSLLRKLVFKLAGV